LPHLRITILPDEAIAATLDHQPYEVRPDLAERGRQAVPVLVQELADEMRCPVRVDVADGGSTYADIVAPGDSGLRGAEPVAVKELAEREVSGTGFTPQEQVAVAVVVAHLDADIRGRASLRLPPALLAGRCGEVVLLGHDSRTVVVGGTA
jgi:hypothetical protein